MVEQGVGARLLRKEDDRLMRGRGEFVADIRLAGMQDVAFVRSPLAHARIRGISIPSEYKDRIFTAADLDGVKPIRAVSGLPGFKASEQPVLASDKVRQVGELVAMCVGPTRAEAEDIAAAVELDFEELPAVHDMLQAREPGSTLVHEQWGDNIFLETFVEVNIDRAFDAPIKVTREICTARQSMAPIEGRGVVASWERPAGAAGRLFSGADAAHRAHRPFGMSGARAGKYSRHFARCRRRLRLQGNSAAGRSLSVVADDASRTSSPLDRGSPRTSDGRRQLPRASLPHHRLCRPRWPAAGHRLRGDGRSGAYSSYPFSACLEAAQVASILPGPLRFPQLIAAGRGRSPPTNRRSCPIAAWRARACASRWR